MKAVEGIEIGFAYGKMPLFSDVNIYISEGECVALTGPSGCGKSTLCYILSGIIPRSIEADYSGEVRLYGDDIKVLTLKQTVERVGIVLQDPDAQLFSPTVEDEIAFGPENVCLPREEIGRRISEALMSVGMQEYRYAKPSKLSGGQKQLVALAASLALRPQTVILDEALSQLDEDSTMLIKEAILKQKAQGRAILLVEHDEKNLDIADRVYTFADGTLKEALP